MKQSKITKLVKKLSNKHSALTQKSKKHKMGYKKLRNYQMKDSDHELRIQIFTI